MRDKAKAEERWQSAQISRKYCDKPRQDGPTLEKLLSRNALPLFVFPGKIEVVYTKPQCDAACEDLRRRLAGQPSPVVGYDRESVAHVPSQVSRRAPRGSNSNRAAIVQLCADDEVCYVFVVHTWGGRCYDSFRDFMQDPTIRKASIGAKNDDTYVNNRFHDVTVAGSVDVGRQVKAISLSAGAPSKFGLANLIEHFFQL